MSAVAARTQRQPAGRRQPQLRVVPPARTRHPIRYGVLIALVAISAVFGTVALSALAAGDAVAAADLERQLVAEQRRYTSLVVEVAALEDPGRLAQSARDELGMVPAHDRGFLVLQRWLPADARPTDGIDDGAQADAVKPVLSGLGPSADVPSDSSTPAAR